VASISADGAYDAAAVYEGAQEKGEQSECSFHLDATLG